MYLSLKLSDERTMTSTSFGEPLGDERSGPLRPGGGGGGGSNPGTRTKDIDPAAERARHAASMYSPRAITRPQAHTERFRTLRTHDAIYGTAREKFRLNNPFIII